MFQIDLVDDAGGRGNDTERLESLSAPFEQLIALGVAFEFHVQILLQSRCRA